MDEPTRKFTQILFNFRKKKLTGKLLFYIYYYPILPLIMTAPPRPQQQYCKHLAFVLLGLSLIALFTASNRA